MFHADIFILHVFGDLFCPDQSLAEIARRIALLSARSADRRNALQRLLNGKAQLAEAEQNRRIKVEEARANLEAEKLNAKAEIERAKGAAEAIKIENGTLTPTYIQYLWVRNQSNLNEKTVIYIPTEANLPILEAGKRNNLIKSE